MFLQNIRRLVVVSYKLELEICLIIPDILRIFRTQKEVSRRANDIIIYSSSAPVVKSGKELNTNLLKILLRHRYFKEFERPLRIAIFKNTSVWEFWRQRTIIFWQYSWMASCQRQLQRYIHFKVIMVTQILNFLWYPTSC